MKSKEELAKEYQKFVEDVLKASKDFSDAGICIDFCTCQRGGKAEDLVGTMRFSGSRHAALHDGFRDHTTSVYDGKCFLMPGRRCVICAWTWRC